MIGSVDIVNKKFCFDSRKVEKGCVFVAIKGKRFDGHDFALEAVSRGASLVVVERDLGIENQIVVENVVDFLIDLASKKIGSSTVIGITGSSGKTFTKEFLSALIPDSFKSPGNMNTEIGLPVSILNEYSGEKFSILEMGVNRKGDIRKLCRIKKPEVGVVLNVGRQHLGFFPSEEDLFKEKMEMFECSKSCVYNADDSRMLEWIGGSRRALGFGKLSGHCKLSDWRYKGLETQAIYEIDRKIYYMKFDKLVHEGHLLNVAASICVLRLLDLPFDPAKIVHLPKIPQRFDTKIVKGALLIDDTYNASLMSFKMAVGALKKLGGRKIAVVGPILEQGRHSRETHGKLSDILSELDATFVIDGFEGSEHINPNNLVFRSFSKEDLAKRVASYLKPGDVALFKASRGVEMERVLKKVIEWM